MIKWTTNKDEMDTESLIAVRANLMAKSAGVEYPIMDATLDIDACHNNGCPLKLDELFTADDFNFAHDVFGIRANINRKTGKLENCFSPRYEK